VYVALFWLRINAEWQDDRYMQLAEWMRKAVSASPGLIRIEQLMVPDGRQLALAYFESEEAIIAWHNHSEHRIVETLGRKSALDDYTIEIFELKRSYTKESSTFVATEKEQRAADKLAANLKPRSVRPSSVTP
jgi:heme-degrading monooxygenase HmoA